MPEPANSQTQTYSKDQEKENGESNAPVQAVRSDRDPRTKSRPTKRGQEREGRGSRSNSPSTKPLSATERPESPKSPSSPGFTSLPPFPASPTSSSKHGRDHSKSFFSNLKASKSSAKIQPAEPTIRKVQQDDVQADDSSRKPARTKSTPDLRGATAAEAVPDLPTLDMSSTHFTSEQSVATHKIPRRPVGHQVPTINANYSNMTTRGTAGPGSPAPESQESRRNPKLFHNFMRRNHSNKSEDAIASSKPATPTFPKPPEVVVAKPPSRDHSTGRNPSPLVESEDYSEGKVQLKDQRSLSFRENASSTLMHGLKNTAKAAGGIGKAGSKFFKQTKQSNVANHQLESAQTYTLKVINRPLKEQTRTTRIAKRLEDSKDKTEFWMPALPWRCIDFLNYNGCEVEGLYRVPGSDREVKMWKQRFDQEYDVNLFEEDDLYDVNTVGSLFKAWLRELPEEIFPLKTQDELSSKYAGEEKAPSEFRDVLSELPPWNYYLLFAITWHLSLLNAYQDKNKMTFHNLYVCFAPALKVNNDCFRWLVADWRNCWKGCITETEALKEEYFILDGGPPHLEPSTPPNELERPTESIESTPRRPGSSSSTNKASMTPPRIRNWTIKEPKPIPVGLGRSKDDSVLPTGREQQFAGGVNLSPHTPSHNRSASQLPELSFPQPISPIFASHN